MGGVKPGKEAKQLFERESKVASRSGMVRMYPGTIKKARGSYIWDADDNKYLDMFAGWSVANVGYSHRNVVKAIMAQLSDTCFCSYATFAHSSAIELAERLVEITPGRFDKKVWLGLSGSDASEFVYKLLTLKFPGKRILSFDGSFHGANMGGMALSGHKSVVRFPGMPNVIKIPYPYCYRCPYDRCYPECNLLCIRQIEEYVFNVICPADAISALVFEPIQSDGGQICPPPGYLSRLSQLLRERGILLIDDEVKVGLGRSGKMFAIEHEDVVPDILILGKSLGAGLPLSAVVGRSELMDCEGLYHAITLAGNPLSCAASVASMDIIQEEDLVSNAQRRGEYLKRNLTAMIAGHRVIGDVRGRGLSLGVECVEDRLSKVPASDVAKMITYRCFELGVLVVYVGMFSNVIELTPPLNISEQECDEFLLRFEQAITEVESGSVATSILELYKGW